MKIGEIWKSKTNEEILEIVRFERRMWTITIPKEKFNLNWKTHEDYWKNFSFKTEMCDSVLVQCLHRPKEHGQVFRYLTKEDFIKNFYKELK